jgi:thioredoxin 1
MFNVQEINENSFVEKILEAEGPVALDLWAPWCGPCRQLSPIVDEIAGENSDKMEFFKLNIDENPAIASQLQVQSIPTILVFKYGGEVKRLVGNRPKKMLLKELSEFLNN